MDRVLYSLRMMLSEGSPAPEWTGKDQHGKEIGLKDFRGSWLLVYFYPKDDTPGCTTEACGLRDNFTELRARGVQVVGISADDEEAHRAFADKFNLPFSLIADTDKSIIAAYGAWGEKSMYGKKYMGILRISFLIGPDGIIRKIYPKVKPAEHAMEILRDMETLA